MLPTRTNAGCVSTALTAPTADKECTCVDATADDAATDDATTVVGAAIASSSVVVVVARLDIRVKPAGVVTCAMISFMVPFMSVVVLVLPATGVTI